MITIDHVSYDDLKKYTEDYADVLAAYDNKSYITHFAYILHIAVPYIRKTYPNIHKEWKAWGIIVLKELFHELDNDDDITNVIDNFYMFRTMSFPPEKKQNEYLNKMIQPEEMQDFVKQFLQYLKLSLGQKNEQNEK